MTVYGKLRAPSLCDKTVTVMALSLQLKALLFPATPGVLCCIYLLILTGVQDTEIDLTTEAFYEIAFK